MCEQRLCCVPLRSLQTVHTATRKKEASEHCPLEKDALHPFKKESGVLCFSMEMRREEDLGKGECGIGGGGGEWGGGRRGRAGGGPSGGGERGRGGRGAWGAGGEADKREPLCGEGAWLCCGLPRPRVPGNRMHVQRGGVGGELMHGDQR